MKTYKSRSGKNSGVIAFEIGDDFIKVQFQSNHVYTYSYRSSEKSIIEKMKTLATNQKGLATFISQNKPGFE